jgi:RNA polymerase sigma-70 factor, ECF subfamily
MSTGDSVAGNQRLQAGRDAVSYSPDVPSSYEVALRECAEGSTSAVGRIYAKERDRLRRVAHRIVRNRDHAEDVVHDAFAQILRDAGNFDPARGSARGWIYTIVRNTALKRLQNSRRHLELEGSELGPNADQLQQDQLQQASQPSPRLAEGAFLRSCLESLEPRRRASLIMAIIDGRTHAEIAEYLGVPIGTVKAWIRRELIALRERLESK